ncbi:putative C2 domain, synaptotagmin-like mitochondrial-lipid-binding domain-containing protein [Lupinus albus]|uniref:Putative C2 domain, synaptotagmin-like mitochondrial-lipid-binding domain-containing protein n=1 Tax=Lupinus albus TaxID=3870 RepID=A0A6A4NEI1_LUPAL|nr:putative C2 domain, synaptotagmin-like mitochondrial-lipid-binding domain-containing protein [Lupinus albus]
MGLLSSLLGIIGFVIGIPLGLLVGFFVFVYPEDTKQVKDPVVRPISDLGPKAVEELLPEIPPWVKTPDYERVDWLNKFLLDMWPFLDKAICGMIRLTAKPIFAEYIGKYQIKGIEFDKLSLGTLPPTLCGIKVLETNEKELVMEQVIKWAGNPNIVLDLHVSSLKISVQLVDLQVFVTLRTTLRPLVPTIPCFAKIVVSLMGKPHVDFGMKISGGDIMAIPGLYGFVQETIKKQVASLYLWPQTLEIPILDESTVAIKKPVGILHVNVVRAHKLLKKDLLGTSDPYVKLTLTGDKLSAKKTSIKMRNLNPEWNEKFKLVVKDPNSQVLQLQVYDWDKVGAHDRLGMQLVPLKVLKPYENKEFTLDLLKDTNINEVPIKKNRGQIVVDLTFVPFKEDSMKFGGASGTYSRRESRSDALLTDDEIEEGSGLLSLVIQEAEEVEGEHHNNPYAVLTFRGEKKKTKMIRKTRHPRWNEEFQFMLEEPPLHEKIHIQVLSKRKNFSFLSKESLGYVEINLNDVVHNGRINDKYHLIDSKNGVIQVEIRWTTA